MKNWGGGRTSGWPAAPRARASHVCYQPRPASSPPPGLEAFHHHGGRLLHRGSGGSARPSRQAGSSTSIKDRSSPARRSPACCSGPGSPSAWTGKGGSEGCSVRNRSLNGTPAPRTSRDERSGMVGACTSSAEKKRGVFRLLGLASDAASARRPAAKSNRSELRS